ncbi:calcium-independent phospholipase a2-gamma [Anaeramoeba ignava]|uniref:Calcium-independent phospholipase a2-gamma n=1 Tax=Anaeramoeba ignava TaxID=1746090 RepID=A0A9Q0L8T1_ANAIG|nr:calcium-independent phospholipase a2-gamma [Anaeramoeba ignava]
MKQENNNNNKEEIKNNSFLKLTEKLKEDLQFKSLMQKIFDKQKENQKENQTNENQNQNQNQNFTIKNNERKIVGEWQNKELNKLKLKFTKQSKNFIVKLKQKEESKTFLEKDLANKNKKNEDDKLEAKITLKDLEDLFGKDCEKQEKEILESKDNERLVDLIVLDILGKDKKEKKKILESQTLDRLIPPIVNSLTGNPQPFMMKNPNLLLLEAKQLLGDKRYQQSYRILDNLFKDEDIDVFTKKIIEETLKNAKEEIENEEKVKQKEEEKNEMKANSWIWKSLIQFDLGNYEESIVNLLNSLLFLDPKDERAGMIQDVLKYIIPEKKEEEKKEEEKEEEKKFKFIEEPEINPKTKQTKDPSKKFILSIDGGGIRGIVPCILLTEIERRTHLRIQDIFDFYAGTSTGGIISLALTRGPISLSPREALDIYIGEQRYKLFERWSSNSRTILDPIMNGPDFLLYSAYTRKGIDGELDKIFGGCTITDTIKNRGIMVTTSAENYGACVFANYPISDPYKSGLFRLNEDYSLTLIDDSSFKMAHVAGATSAAAPIFPPLTLEKNDGKRITFVDGGFIINNPAAAALVTCRDISNYSLDDTYLLSLNTSTDNLTPVYNWRANLGVIGFLTQSKNFLYQENQVTANLTNRICTNMIGDRYFRFTPFDPEIDSVSIDEISPENIRRIWNYGVEMIEDLDNQEDNLLNKFCDIVEEYRYANYEFSGTPNPRRFGIGYVTNKVFETTRQQLEEKTKKKEKEKEKEEEKEEEREGLGIGRYRMDKESFKKIDEIFTKQEIDEKELSKRLKKFFDARLYSFLKKNDEIKYANFSRWSKHPSVCIASSVGHLSSLQYYSQTNSPLDSIKGPSDWTALHYAAANNEIDSIQFLIFYDILSSNISEEVALNKLKYMECLTDKKKTALQLAKEEKSKQAIELLTELKKFFEKFIKTNQKN